MNYYPFNVGDYASHTAHLEPMEDLAYRRMLDLYYRTEKPLPASVEDIARLIRLRDYAAFIRDVLNEFFRLTDAGWKHERCDAELAKMQDKQTKAKASAQASVNARSTNAQRTLSERSTVVELPTPTPIPIQNPPTPDGVAPPEPKAQKSKPTPCPDDVAAEVWADWLALRKAKKAPVTGTVVESARGEAVKAGMTFGDFLRVWCARGSQGLQAEWLKPDERPHARASPTAAETRVMQAVPGLAAPHLRPAQKPLMEVFDVTPRALG